MISEQEKNNNTADGTPKAVPVRLNDWLGVLQLFVKAAKKQQIALDGNAWGHAAYCNYTHPYEGQTFCNCGIADLQYALKTYLEMQNA